jgi:hypothetical protein
MKRTPLKRSTKPIRKKRPGTRKGQPTPEEIKVVRLAVYERSRGRCELNLGPKCIKGVLPLDGETPWDHWHLVHIRSKSLGGWGLDNLKGGCWKCHLIGMHEKGLKPE